MGRWGHGLHPGWQVGYAGNVGKKKNGRRHKGRRRNRPRHADYRMATTRTAPMVWWRLVWLLPFVSCHGNKRAG